MNMLTKLEEIKACLINGNDDALDRAIVVCDELLALRGTGGEAVTDQAVCICGKAEPHSHEELRELFGVGRSVGGEPVAWQIRPLPNGEWQDATPCEGTVAKKYPDRYEWRELYTAAADAPENELPSMSESGWTPEQALRFYAEGKHFDVVDGRTRILDTGSVASDALKGMSAEYNAMKGNAPSNDALAKRLLKAALDVCEDCVMPAGQLRAPLEKKLKALRSAAAALGGKS